MVTFALNTSIVQTSTSLVLAAGTTATQPLLADDGITDGITGGDGLLDLAGPSTGEDIYLVGSPPPLAEVVGGQLTPATAVREEDTRPVGPPPPDTSLSPLQAGLAVFAGTTLAASHALAGTGLGVSVGINANLAQIITLCILYGIPITRGLVRASRALIGRQDRAPMTDQTGALNNLTGQLEYSLGPFRNVIVKLWIAGSLLLDPYRSLLGYVPLAVALGLCWFSNRSRSQVVAELTDRAAAVVEQNRQSDPNVKGLRQRTWYRHFKRALGIRGPDVARTLQEGELYRVNTEMNPVVNPRRSLWRNIRAFRETLRFTGHLGDQASQGQGFWRTIREKANVFFRGGVAPATPEGIQRGNVLARQWGINMTDVEQVRQVELIGTEKVVGKRCMFAGINHSGWEDYAAALMLSDPHTGESLGIRPGADKYNFHDFYLLRLTSIPFGFDKLGLPYFMRPDKRTIGQRIFGHRYDWVQDMANKMAAGIQPLIFVKGSRDVRTYLEDGHLDMPGLYDVVQKKYQEHPERFMAIGIAEQASRVAAESGEPIHIAILRMPKGHHIAPKVGSKPPLLQATLTGQTKAIEIADTIEVRPDMSRKKVFEQLQARSREVSGIDRLLADRTREWARQFNRDPALADTFAERAERDVRWAILADRIRTIPPRSQNGKAGAAREEHQKTFLSLLESPPDEERLHRELVVVSKTAKKYQYDPWYLRIYDLSRGLLGIPRQRYIPI